MNLFISSKPRTSSIVLLLVLSIVLAACGGAPATTTEPASSATGATTTETSAAASTEASAASAEAASTEASAASGATDSSLAMPADAADEQILRVSTGTSGAASFIFTPLRGGGDQQNWQTLMWMPPMYFDEDLQLQPGVFDSWEPNDDFTTWTFTIDPRAKWSDNTPITASDVKGTWELMANPLVENSRIRGYIGRTEGFDAVASEQTTDMTGLVVKDDRTLEVNLTGPDPLLHWRLATTHMNPVKVEQARGAIETFWRPENKPSVSGPYMLESYDPDGLVATLVKNPNWWLDEGPYLDRIEMRFAPDPDTVATMVQNGEIDASLVPISRVFQQAIPDYFRPITTIGFQSYWMSPVNEPTDDINVRKALVLSVNFEDVLKATYPQGEGVAATQVLDPDVTCYDSSLTGYPYDPEAAKAALAASKYGSADRLPKIRVTPRGADPALTRGLETIVEFWRQNLGITNVEFKQTPEEFGPDAERLNFNRDDVVVRFPDGATYMWTAAHSAGPISNADNTAGYSNPEVDKLLDEALGTPIDDPKRCELTRQAQELFMNDYMLIWPGDEQKTINAQGYVKNYMKGPDVTLIAPWKIYIANH